jgi:hypothetical protein
MRNCLPNATMKTSPTLQFGIAVTKPAWVDDLLVRVDEEEAEHSTWDHGGHRVDRGTGGGAI